MEIPDEGIKVKSLYKALKLLDYFDPAHPERGISELAGQSGLLKSSVHNIMSTFQKCGFIEKNTKTGKYRLGLKILVLSNVLSQTDDLRQIVKPYMDKLAQETRETVFLATPYEGEIVYVETAFPRENVSARSVKGVVAPMYCTSIGKAIMAFEPEERIREIIEKGLAPFTPNTITDPGRFREELERTRERGYAIDDMEHEYGIKCVGVPIRNSGGAVVAAISLTGPSLRFTGDKIVEYAARLEAAAQEIGRRIL